MRRLMKNKNDKAIKEQLLSPINVIHGFIQLFEMDDNLTSSQIKRIEEINLSIAKIIDVIEHIPEQSLKETITAEDHINNLILVVEDNLTNQELLLQQLDMLGYSADTANNGQEALEKLEHINYPMILTDLNMPVIDGYELTKEIREMELNTVQHKIIIAITANALVGEKEKCLQLGMDAYLSKPLNILDLKTLLAKFNEDITKSYSNNTKSDKYKTDNTTKLINNQTSDSNASSTKTSHSQIIDKSCLIHSIGNDHSKHITVLKSYLKHAPEVINELSNAYNERNIEQVQFYSHKIKSSSYSIGATELADANKAIEQAASENNWIIIDSIAPNIERLYKEAEAAIIEEYFGNSDS